MKTYEQIEKELRAYLTPIAIEAYPYPAWMKRRLHQWREKGIPLDMVRKAVAYYYLITMTGLTPPPALWIYRLGIRVYEAPLIEALLFLGNWIERNFYPRTNLVEVTWTCRTTNEVNPSAERIWESRIRIYVPKTWDADEIKDAYEKKPYLKLCDLKETLNECIEYTFDVGIDDACEEEDIIGAEILENVPISQHLATRAPEMAIPPERAAEMLRRDITQTTTPTPPNYGLCTLWGFLLYCKQQSCKPDMTMCWPGPKSQEERYEHNPFWHLPV